MVSEIWQFFQLPEKLKRAFYSQLTHEKPCVCLLREVPCNAATHLYSEPPI